jgi:phosphoglycerol transferase MdoB-like AlkP superfamily enzyme
MHDRDLAGGRGHTGLHLLRLLARLAAGLLLLSTAGRLLLLAWQWPRLADLDPATRLMALLHGLRMDLILVSWLLLPLLLLLTLAPPRAARPVALMVRGWALLALCLVLFVEMATPPFMAQYDVRPNLLFVQYLDYPIEVARLLWSEQRFHLIASAGALAVLAGVFVRCGAWADAQDLLRTRWVHRALWLAPLALLLLVGIRSSLGHRPANIADALYSVNRVANEIAKNSVYSVAYETYRARKSGVRKAPRYGRLSLDEAHARTRRMLGMSAAASGIGADAESPLARTVAPSHPSSRPRNLVIIVQESMSAAFVGHLGAEGGGVTPQLDALARNSVSFSRLHAGGTRSIQGLAAMSAGFVSLPGDGVLKRAKAQRGFFSLASLLKPLGYHASFIYGGEARFDDMKVWYLGNGFDEVIEQKDFSNPGFVATWGVSDEDLLLKAHERYLAHHAAGRPFVSVVFSQSNHAPFELPEGKIEWEPGVPRQSVRNAVKYADYAVGRFMALAQASAYYRDTVFVVVADHTERAAGEDAVPVPGFRIPGLVHLAGVPPQRVDEITSQPDLLATALGMVGVPLRFPIFGTSVFTAGRQAFVLMHFNDTYGFMRGEQVLVMRPERAPQTFRYQGGRLHEAPHDLELALDGLSLLHVAEDLYDRQRYR